MSSGNYSKRWTGRSLFSRDYSYKFKIFGILLFEFKVPPSTANQSSGISDGQKGLMHMFRVDLVLAEMAANLEVLCGR
jgi:hypothetical protein